MRKGEPQTRCIALGGLIATSLTQFGGCAAIGGEEIETFLRELFLSGLAAWIL